MVAHHIAPRMVPCCSFFRSLMAFTVCTPYCSEDGSTLRILSVVNCFLNAFLSVLLIRWLCIADSFTHEQLSRWFACCIGQPTAVHCSFFCSLIAFPTICAPYSSVDGNVLRFFPLVNGVHCLGTILLRRWHHITYSSTRQQVSPQFALHIALRIAAHCSFFHSSKAFQIIRTPYCLDGSEFLVLQLTNGFHNSLCALLSSGWQRIPHSFARQHLSQRFMYRLAQWMLACCSFFRLSIAFTVHTP